VDECGENVNEDGGGIWEIGIEYVAARHPELPLGCFHIAQSLTVSAHKEDAIPWFTRGNHTTTTNSPEI
jgi:hypothetical protein